MTDIDYKRLLVYFLGELSEHDCDAFVKRHLHFYDLFGGLESIEKENIKQLYNVLEEHYPAFQNKDWERLIDLINKEETKNT